MRNSLGPSNSTTWITTATSPKTKCTTLWMQSIRWWVTKAIWATKIIRPRKGSNGYSVKWIRTTTSGLVWRSLKRVRSRTQR
uniref:Uncharacterized protein n=1 Tax=Strigamia maritima TaxID=126957 RepID=T1IVN1_STRMM